MFPLLPLPIPSWWLLGLIACTVTGLAMRTQIRWRWLSLIGIGSCYLLALTFGAASLVTIPTHALSIGAGLLLGWWLWRKQLGDIVAERTHIVIALSALVAASIGARIWYVIEFWPLITQQAAEGTPLWLVAIDLASGGMVLYGGVVAGVSVGIWQAKRLGASLMSLLDSGTGPAFCAIALGRLGCFFNGCCYGGVSNLPWAFPQHTCQLPQLQEQTLHWQQAPSYLVYHEQVIRPALGYAPISDELIAAPRNPVQLYETFICSLFAVCFIAVHPRLQSRPGTIAGMGLIAYGSWRFINEILRADNPTWLLGMSASQMLSIGIICLGIALIARRPATIGAKAN